MSLNQMDMNVVMYPEITGDKTKPNKVDKRPKPLQCQRFGRYCYIKLCNVKIPNNTELQKMHLKRIKILIYRKYEPLCLEPR